MKFSEKLKKRINEEFAKGNLPEKYQIILTHFLEDYENVLIVRQLEPDDYLHVFEKFVELTIQFVHHPHLFEPYHERIRQPFDYYQFGLDFLGPLVDMKRSSVKNLSQFDAIESFLKQKHNVILFANHQIEADPQAISLMLEKTHPRIGEEMIFVAGERVLTDPLAIPFSMGRNLLCIYSKKYIDNPPEDKLKKQLHNKKTMTLMSELLTEGGKVIYVAPSGGRDRRNEEGKIEVAPFDPQSIEMFYLMAKRAKTPTHFFPLALSTYSLLPPPDNTQIELGERRATKGGAIHLCCGNEINMEKIPGANEGDKHQTRQRRTEYIWNLVKEDYAKFPKET